jgi:hypothetical protein
MPLAMCAAERYHNSREVQSQVILRNPLEANEVICILPSKVVAEFVIKFLFVSLNNSNFSFSFSFELDSRLLPQEAQQRERVEERLSECIKS